MDLQQLRTFLTILEHGSFSRAAEVLHLTQSTVSFRLKALEDSLGVVLIERRSRPPRPTAAGETLRPRALRILAQCDEAVEELRQRAAGQAGALLVAASTIPAAYLLPPALARLRELSPGLSVNVEVTDSRQALFALRAGTCDLAVVGAREADKGIVFTPIAADQVVLVGRPDTASAWGEPVDLSTLAEAPLILREEGSGTLATVADILARRAALGARPPTVRVGSSAAARQCLLQGLGWSFISRLAVAEDLDAGRLVEIPLVGTPVARSFWAARRRARAEDPAVRRLVRALSLRA